MAWATVTDVSTITGSTVDAGQLARATSLIELAVGRTEDNTFIPARDLRWLKRAVAYQAAWMLAQPDLLTKADVKSSSQDGAWQVYKGGQLLAPLAKKCLKKLTWRGNRSVHTESTLTTDSGHFYLGTEGIVSIFDYQWDRWRQES